MIFDELEYFARKRLKRLKVVVWECTKKCNLNCRHCYLRKNNKGRELGTEIVKDVFQSLKTRGVKGLTVAITGGEPLLREDIWQILHHINNLGYSWTMVTNGTLIDREVASRIVGANPKLIAVSIDGSKPSHDWLRGEGSWDLTKRGLENLLATGYEKDKLMIKTLVSNQNISGLRRFGESIKKTGIKSWHWLTAINFANNRGVKDLFLDAKKKKEIDGLAKAISRELDLEIVINEGKGFCVAGIESLAILSDGAVVPCVNSRRRGQLVQGNVLTDDIWYIWDKGFKINREASYYGCKIH